MGLTYEMLAVVQYLLFIGSGLTPATRARLERIETYLIRRYNRGNHD